jgi:topoisomerase-4 subunit A
MISRNKAGKVFLTLEKDERPLMPVKVGADDTADTAHQRVAALSDTGRLLMFALTELKEMARGRGLMLISLTSKENLSAIALVSNHRLRIQGIGRAGKSVEGVLEPMMQAPFHGHRARRGQEIPFKMKPVGLSVDA